VALFAYAFISVSPLWLPAAERGGIEICTANGIRIIPGGSPFDDVPTDGQKQTGNCPLCLVQAGFLLPLANGAIEPVDHGQPQRPWITVDHDATRVFAGFHHASRAPPLSVSAA